MAAMVTRQTRIREAIRGGGAAGLAWLMLGAIGITESLGMRTIDWLDVALLVGAIVGWLGGGAVIRGLAAGATAATVLVATVPWVGKVALYYVRTDPLPREPVDAVLVLSAAVSRDARLSPPAVDRLLEGLRLTRSGLSRQLVVSRVWAHRGVRPISSDADQRELIELVDPTVATEVLDSVGTTRLEAVRMGALAAHRGWRRVVVVTSPIHSRRSCAAVERTGLTVVCRPSPDRTAAVIRQGTATDRVRAFGQWSYEFLGWWEYRLRGWV